MRQLRSIFWTLTLLAVALGTATAETEYTVTGQVRVRGEIDDKNFFESDTRTLSFGLLRTRLAVEANIHEDARAFVQLQDSRTLGGTNEEGLATSGTLNDGENVDLHQGYLELDNLLVDGLGARGGRFEVVFGNQRVFGSVGWSNVGRSWEGAQLWFKHQNFRLDGFWLKRLEKNTTDGNRDYDIIGVNLDFPETGLELLGVYEHDGDGATINLRYVNNLDRVSFGGYFHRKFAAVDFTANVLYQAGTLRSDLVQLDISAYLLTGEVGIDFEDSPLQRLAGGFDIASGDDSPNDSDWNAYNNLYYTGHKFRGFMDYFVASDVAGLVDLYATGSFQLHQSWWLNGAFHYFTSAADRVVGSETTKDLGVEFDFTVKTMIVPGVMYNAGLSLFLPDESFAGVDDPDTGLWLYCMTTANF